MEAAIIRKKFVEFFARHGHEVKESSSLVPHNDPTLLFANAGMNQFKDYFTGKATPPVKRAVTVQKCVRAGGKHNDLENVGFTARHHTFFEMLGNFSFGDYFKKEAIAFAWEFLTKELNIPAEKLYVTVHTSDDEAYRIWHEEMKLDSSKIYRKGDKDNFWEMGDVGPCGPCSEIYFDHGEKYATPGFSPKDGEDILDDGGRYVEIWNLVFMQFEKTKDGTHPLPKPSVDTGAGLERISALMQGKYWNYDSDLFAPITAELEKITGKKYSDPKNAGSMRVVADHIRSSSMLITDGVIPSNEGRGYVLRRIIRRAIRHLKELGAPAGSYSKIVPVVFEILGTEYPQNKVNMNLAIKMLTLEEEKFLSTLDLGMKFLETALETEIDNKTLKGAAVFKLYDTYGFPYDLTETILKERNLKVDEAGFNKAMAEQKEQSKKSWKQATGVDQSLFFSLKEKHGVTQFKGYDNLSLSAKLLAIENAGEEFILIFDQTPFYAESGGQLGDKGQILLDQMAVAEVRDVQKPVDGLFAHLVKDASLLKVGEKYTLLVNKALRDQTAANHTATHLLQAALITVLGDHVKQSGSMVSADRLRFDFTHPQGVTKEELQKVEEIVNQKITAKLPLKISNMTKDEAMKSGATALFGEKYGDTVRVVNVKDYSTELCGGTHVENTDAIKLFSIVSEAALSTGIRRVEAISGAGALSRLKERSFFLEQVENHLKVKNEVVPERVLQLQESLKTQSKEMEGLQERLQKLESEVLFANPEMVGDVALKVVEVKEELDLRKLSDHFFDKHQKGVLFLYALKKDKYSILLRRSKTLTEVHASDALNSVLKQIGGKAGGKDDLAQGSISGDIHFLKTELVKVIKQNLL